MPSLSHNKETWEHTYTWSEAGDEWSASWGGPQMQWYSSLYPRIRQFLPSTVILEIACGYGRWTRFLNHQCDRLYAVDLSERCIQSCRARFAGDPRLQFYLNDGRSLEMIPDHSVDFVFSFDSLVHADAETVRLYLSQLPRLLTGNGAAFIHHSNLGEYASYRRFPRLSRSLAKLGLWDWWHYRDPYLTATAAAEYGRQAGLVCLRQEIVPWGTRRMLIDCMSTFVMPGSPLAGETRLLRNRRFMQERRLVSDLARLYG
jgi:SAM-dependent methyltransferase